jgi:hypothetical protein
MAIDQHAAALTVIETITAMAGEGVPLMLRVLPAGEARYWEHYPDNDARDERTRSRWYYHVHAPGDRDPGEHGHFHLFLHRTQLDDPAAYDVAPATGEAAPAHVTHIAGLAINHAGIPVSWFVTNRWVTDEFLYPAETLIAHLDRYDVDRTGEDPLVNRLLTAMVALYRDELAGLLRARDRALTALVAAEGISAYEAGHDVLESIPIDLDAKIESLGFE